MENPAGSGRFPHPWAGRWGRRGPPPLRRAGRNRLGNALCLPGGDRRHPWTARSRTRPTTPMIRGRPPRPPSSGVLGFRPVRDAVAGSLICPLLSQGGPEIGIPARRTSPAWRTVQPGISPLPGNRIRHEVPPLLHQIEPQFSQRGHTLVPLRADHDSSHGPGRPGGSRMPAGRRHDWSPRHAIAQAPDAIAPRAVRRLLGMRGW